MLASGAELGVNRETAGIIELDGLQPGASIGPSPDWLIEIDNKSLTHRPDLGGTGMAREIAAITRQPLRDPVDLSLLPRESEGGIEVRIEDFDLCPRYSALVLENVTVQASPLWLQARLEAVGLNPINNVVDVTNFVMAEIAQPMHAFDADKLNGGIVVRRAARGERIMALNNEEYELQVSVYLVIADQESAIAVAGVIGGLFSAIGPETKRIIRPGKRELSRRKRSENFWQSEAAHGCFHAVRKSTGSGEYSQRPRTRAGAFAAGFARNSRGRGRCGRPS